MARIQLPNTRPSLRPTAVLTLLAVLLAVTAAIVAQRFSENTERIIEARARLALVLATQTELRLERLREAFASVTNGLAPGEIPDEPHLALLLEQLRNQDQAFSELVVVDDTGTTVSSAPARAAKEPGGLHEAFPWLRDAARPGSLTGGLYPAQNGTVRILFSKKLIPDGRGTHLRAEAETSSLPTTSEASRDLTILLVHDDGTLSAATTEAAISLDSALTTAVRALARSARESGALAQREIAGPGETRRIAVAAPMRSEPLALVLLVPAAAQDTMSETLPAIFLALAGVVLAVFPLLRKKRRRP